MEGRRLLAYLLIAIGGIALLDRVSGTADWLWVGLAAAAFLVGYNRRRAYGLLVVGCILAGIAAGLLLESYWGWEGMFLVGLGLGFLIIQQVEPRQNRWPVFVAGLLVLLGVLNTAIGSGFFTSAWFPLLLVLAGAYLLGPGRRDRATAPRQGTPPGSRAAPAPPRSPTAPASDARASTAPTPATAARHTPAPGTSRPPAPQPSSGPTPPQPPPQAREPQATEPRAPESRTAQRQAPEARPAPPAADGAFAAGASHAAATAPTPAPVAPPEVPATTHGSPAAEGAVGARIRALTEWRSTRALAEDRAPYLILDNDTIDELARINPSSEAELRTVRGIGPVRYERYGPEILRVLSEAGAG